MTLSLSTMWAQQDRFRDLLRFREAVATMGYDAHAGRREQAEQRAQPRLAR